jgi:tryptophan halogenase
MKQLQNIIIVGGGSSGLIAALIIKNTYPGIDLTVIESSNIGIIGVGEGTIRRWPEFIRYCNIDLEEMIKETDAVYKFGIKFDNWNGDGKSYTHSLLFDESVSGQNYFHEYTKSYPYMFAWMVAEGKTTEEMISKFMVNNQVPLAPCVNDGIPLHFNTFKLNAHLHTLCNRIGIKFIQTELVGTNVDENGVTSLVDKDNCVYPADFFIDCSGFARVVSKSLGSKWLDYRHYLPVNHAIAFPTETDGNLPLFTSCTSLSAGWAWKTPTYGRYGNGYVFNDAYIDSAKAQAETEQLYGHPVEIFKDIKFGAGKIDKFWNKNCLSIGLSGSFSEPLEATSIGFLIEQTFAFVDQIRYWTSIPEKIESHYNNLFDASFQNTIDYVQLHYYVKRKDTPFWKELAFTPTDFNRETVDMFRHKLPCPSLFTGEHQIFGPLNWIQIMHGLDMFDRESIKRELHSLNFKDYSIESLFKQRHIRDQTVLTMSQQQFLDNLHKR